MQTLTLKSQNHGLLKWKQKLGKPNTRQKLGFQFVLHETGLFSKLPLQERNIPERVQEVLSGLQSFFALVLHFKDSFST